MDNKTLRRGASAVCGEHSIRAWATQTPTDAVKSLAYLSVQLLVLLVCGISKCLTPTTPA